MGFFSHLSEMLKKSPDFGCSVQYMLKHAASYTQSAFTCPNVAIKTLEQDLKHVQS